MQNSELFNFFALEYEDYPLFLSLQTIIEKGEEIPQYILDKFGNKNYKLLEELLQNTVQHQQYVSFNKILNFISDNELITLINYNHTIKSIIITEQYDLLKILKEYKIDFVSNSDDALNYLIFDIYLNKTFTQNTEALNVLLNYGASLKNREHYIIWRLIEHNKTDLISHLFNISPELKNDFKLTQKNLYHIALKTPNTYEWLKKLGLQYQQHINQIIYTAAVYKNKELIYHILENEKYNVDDELLYSLTIIQDNEYIKKYFSSGYQIKSLFDASINNLIESNNIELIQSLFSSQKIINEEHLYNIFIKAIQSNNKPAVLFLNNTIKIKEFMISPSEISYSNPSTLELFMDEKEIKKYLNNNWKDILTHSIANNNLPLAEYVLCTTRKNINWNAIKFENMRFIYNECLRQKYYQLLNKIIFIFAGRTKYSNLGILDRIQFKLTYKHLNDYEHLIISEGEKQTILKRAIREIKEKYNIFHQLSDEYEEFLFRTSLEENVKKTTKNVARLKI